MLCMSPNDQLALPDVTIGEQPRFLLIGHAYICGRLLEVERKIKRDSFT